MNYYLIGAIVGGWLIFSGIVVVYNRVVNMERILVGLLKKQNEITGEAGLWY